MIDVYDEGNFIFTEPKPAPAVRIQCVTGEDAMEIYETHVTPQKDGLSEYRVEFVYEGGKRVAVILKDEVPGVFDEQALIAKARTLLHEADTSGDMPSYKAGNQNNLRADMQEQQPVSRSYHLQQPEGPVPPKNPLLDDEPDAATKIVGVKNEGMIEP